MHTYFLSLYPQPHLLYFTSCSPCLCGLCIQQCILYLSLFWFSLKHENSSLFWFNFCSGVLITLLESSRVQNWCCVTMFCTVTPFGGYTRPAVLGGKCSFPPQLTRAGSKLLVMLSLAFTLPLNVCFGISHQMFWLMEGWSQYYQHSQEDIAVDLQDLLVFDINSRFWSPHFFLAGFD